MARWREFSQALWYDAFGDIRAMTAGRQAPRNVFDFTAQQRDVETDMLYLRARYYEGTLGRFITRDTLPPVLTTPLMLNPYIYAQDNPVNWMDPSGRCVPACLVLAPAVPTLAETVVVILTVSTYVILQQPAAQEALHSAVEEIFEFGKYILPEVGKPARPLEPEYPTAGRPLPSGTKCTQSLKALVLCIAVGTTFIVEFLQRPREAAKEIQSYLDRLLPKK